MQNTLNSELFASAIKTKRGNKGLRETASEIDTSPATLSRVEQGNLPDVETFIKICKWLEVPTDTFVTGEKIALSELSEKDRIVYQLRSSRELTKDTITAMVTMIELAFLKLNSNA